MEESEIDLKVVILPYEDCRKVGSFNKLSEIFTISNSIFQDIQFLHLIFSFLSNFRPF